MKGIICYYSGTGNAELACRYIAGKLEGIDIDLHNIAKDGMPGLESYDLVGFATFADYWAPSVLIQRFLEKVPLQSGKPAFVFNTYGFISGRTQKILSELVASRGFKVVAGHSLHTPENFPPMIVKGRDYSQAPNEKEMLAFDAFISELNAIVVRMEKGEKIEKVKIRGFLLPPFSRKKARKDMGKKFVDTSLCTKCGVCKEACPYGAIELRPWPVFRMEKCYGCWACYNLCPKKAIYTERFRGRGHYSGPPEIFKKKLTP